MTQGFTTTKVEGLTSVDGVCLMESGTVTVTGSGGDVTVTLTDIADWTGGHLYVCTSTATTDYYTAGGTGWASNQFTSYDALTNAGYTDHQITALHYPDSNANANVYSWNKTINNSGTPKSATTTSFTLDDSGTTIYVKYFVYAPCDLDALKGDKGDTGNGNFESGTFTQTSGAGDTTVTLSKITDWTGGYLKVVFSKSTGDWANNTNGEFTAWETSYDALIGGSYDHNDNLIAILHGGYPDVRGSNSSMRASPVTGGSTTSFIINDDAADTYYVKWFVWA